MKEKYYNKEEIKDLISENHFIRDMIDDLTGLQHEAFAEEVEVFFQTKGKEFPYVPKKSQVLYSSYDHRGVRFRIIVTGRGLCSMNCFGDKIFGKCKRFGKDRRHFKKTIYYKRLPECIKKYGVGK